MWPVGVCRSRLSARIADEDDRAGDRQRHAEDDAGRPVPAEGSGDQGAEACRDDALRDRARDRHPPDGEQFLDVKLQADAEHEQDDADLGELLGDAAVGDEARRVRARPAFPRAGSRRSATGRGAA